jgi:putative lipase involved disintegration of autophagic bodies
MFITQSSTSSSTPRPPSVTIITVGLDIPSSTLRILSMRRLLYLLCLSLIALLSSAKQHPFSSPSSSNHQQFSAIGILDVGVGPKYRQYKRYLPIYPLTSLQATLHHDEPLNIRSLARNTTQHPIRNRESIAFAVTQSRLAKYTAQSPVIPWTTKEILIPDVTDLVTVTTLAQIANNAYIEAPRTFDWIDVDGPWNLTSDFGWEKNGLRGHVFASEGNETIIISLKGTSPAVFMGGGTGGNDKINVLSRAYGS